jgi:GTP-binding protein
MSSFVDELDLTLSSGHGGAGAVNFRREKYVPRGGPDGGDGGKGGNVVIRQRRDLRTLVHLTGKKSLAAMDGRAGQKRNRHGSDGDDLIVEVPPGTVVIDVDTGQTVVDFAETESVNLLEGGRGGKGNAHFATSRHQAPRFAQKGEPGRSINCRIELRLMADIGLLGLPNAGKSSLLSALSNARPRIASYPFTTLTPQLGVVSYADRDIVLADIPGIIEGAAEGHGLGTKFLKHISRARKIIYLIDLSDPAPASTVGLLQRELARYGEGLAEKERILVGNKTDIADRTACEDLRSAFPDEPVFCVSVATRDGLSELTAKMVEFVYSQQER